MNTQTNIDQRIADEIARVELLPIDQVATRLARIPLALPGLVEEVCTHCKEPIGLERVDVVVLLPNNLPSKHIECHWQICTRCVPDLTAFLEGMPKP